jgi:hypothetical protein
VAVSVVTDVRAGRAAPRLKAEADRIGKHEAGYEGGCTPAQLASERHRWDASGCGHRDFEIPLVDLGSVSTHVWHEAVTHA